MARQSPKTPEPLEPPGSEQGRTLARREAALPVFQKPERPDSVWELLAWMVFEYPLLERYAQTLSWRQWVPLFGQAYLVIAFLASVLYLTGIALTVGLELPARFPEVYRPEIHEAFTSHLDSPMRVRLLIGKTASEFAAGLAMGLAGGLAVCMARGMAGSLAGGLAVCMAVSMAAGLAVGLAGSLAGVLQRNLATNLAAVLAWGLVGGMAVGLAVGLAGSLAWGLAWGLVWGLAMGLQGGQAFGLEVSLVWGLAWGLAGILAGILAGYGRDQAAGPAGILVGGMTGILVGIVGAAFGFVVVMINELGPGGQRLVDLALVVAPGTAFAFTAGCALGFLRIPFYPWHVSYSVFHIEFYRNPYLHDGGIRLPLPGVRVQLTALAQEDPETARRFIAFLLEYRPLQRGLAMHLTHAAAAGEWRQHVLDPDHLLPPEVVAEETRLQPSEAWVAALRALGAELRSSELQSHIGLKKEAFERFARGLDSFREQTLHEPYRWHRYYLGAIDLWQEEARKQLATIEHDAQRLEPISPNVYRPRDALKPETNRDVFVGREDLRERLAWEILTARSMPMLLIQGQRRVGKTSLLNFLPELLGPRFVVVHQDLQDARIRSIPTWITDLRRCIKERLGQLPDGWQAPEDWLDAWAELEQFLMGVSVPMDHKLILAFDEYQELHTYLSQDPARGGRLLGAMRSFSQRQNQVVFMFVGSELLSELQGPDWANYFVQTVRFPVDYLSKDDTVRLITAPVRLRYVPEVLEWLYELTQGHPALLQLLCHKLVGIANREGRRDLSLPDLEQALAEAIERETSVFTVFWNQFCRQRGCRQAVEQILRGETPEDRAALMQLKEHGYIAGGGRCRMRVPLFDTWLRRYKDAFT